MKIRKRKNRSESNLGFVGEKPIHLTSTTSHSLCKDLAANTCLFDGGTPVHKIRLFALLTIILLLTKQPKENAIPLSN